MSKNVIIIGAGLTGLSAGIHLQQKGIRTEIFEISGQAGGMCIAWERQGYRFDSCIHWMVGTKAGDSFHDLYREVDALAADTPIYNTEFLEFEMGGKPYKLPMRFPAFKEFLVKLFPEDSKALEEFCRNVEIMTTAKMPTGAPGNPFELIRMFRESGGFLNIARKYTGMTVGEYLQRFRNPMLKTMMTYLMPPEYAMTSMFMMLGTRISGNAGYPLGGAYEVVQRMEKKYRALGGTIHFQSKVDEILIENGKATGVRSKGSLYKADSVIAACDMYGTLKKMLGGRYAHKQLDSMLENAPLFPPICYVSLGLDRRFGMPESNTLECPNPIQTAPGYTTGSLFVRAFDFDPSAAPANCSSVMVLLQSSLDYWENLRKENLSEYRAKKQQLAEDVITVLDERFPGFRESIKVTDVSTPATYIRYSDVYKGSWEGFAPIPSSLKVNIRKTVDGVRGLRLAGQWTTPGGGLCTAVHSGKEAAEAVAKSL